tara:strand:- start:146 stop:523 length:378 start_codon:yes stop_codon:yes gene_type:complete
MGSQAAVARCQPPAKPARIFFACKVVYNVHASCMEYVNYIALGCSIAALALSFIACARVGKFIKATADTDWETLANLTGDIAALKRTCQTLNNRLNGMNKATIPQEQIIQQMLAHQNVEPIARGG